MPACNAAPGVPLPAEDAASEWVSGGSAAGDLRALLDAGGWNGAPAAFWRSVQYVIQAGSVAEEVGQIWGGGSHFKGRDFES